MIKLVKKLVFNFYVNDSTYKSDINRLHIRLLTHYIDVFDEILISFTNESGEVDENISELEKYFLTLHKRGRITFKVSKNNSYRESQCFYDEVICNIKDNELVFFGHNKGITNVNSCKYDEIATWVCGMYYLNLEYMDEVIKDLITTKSISYGAFLTKNNLDVNLLKYEWCYAGTFFWLNTSKLLQYFNNNNLDVPVPNDRFYDEELLGNTYPMWPSPLAASHGCLYMEDAVNFYDYTTYYITAYFNDDSELDRFKSFKEQMLKIE